MLILVRNVGEKIMIGDEVLVSVSGVKGTQVAIGVQASVNISIHRQEVFDRIARKRKLARDC
ncbi:carbon storage regulator (plasmid) [Pseudomonas sp. HR96]|uniref:carbon storage regulator n=1 Tax=Pseudomonas sp. HR96 TaxID=1027966 RepID=UPI002A765867|nr:carbon storage regulator [Pseudomonas sp. HR96]WPP02463.1 carbon storage regulator [Pseudomonas sp. HR96]